MTETQRSELIERLAAGDPDALPALLIEYHPILHAKVAERMPRDVRSLIEPEDVLQKAYIAVFATLGVGGAPGGPSEPNCAAPAPRPTFASPAAFYSWLETLVLRDMREAIEGLHAAKRDARRVVHGGGRDSMVAALQTLAAVTDSTPSRAMAREEAAGLLLISLARLTEDQRRVVQLRFFESEPVKAVAAALGKTEDAVHALTYRALRELRGMMDGALRTRG